jgi:hypothetical protein
VNLLRRINLYSWLCRVRAQTPEPAIYAYVVQQTSIFPRPYLSNITPYHPMPQILYLHLGPVLITRGSFVCTRLLIAVAW